ncbi:superoxide dismutase [Sandaracinobacter sp. RS1-74]|uniref:superoxide dismutase n=1 Tax=Sandaracinobacteroides sayramensis TaxID=2913411 RepID=UPI001EDA3F73|nr:superoxide dismutase [Sandaracinobacteroides sayramensis]MCG2839694.1 superoxide dismutase [Sandaracinobacteroides sayramensis]
MLKPFAALLLAVAAPAAIAQTAPAAAPAAQGPFVLDALPYAANALAPVIDQETMELHWGKHHRAYVDNLNKAVTADPALKGVSLEQLLARVSTLPKAVRDNGGGHWNHRFFWALMAPEGKRGAPSAPLLAAIERDFGGLDKFKAAFQQAGATQFGSGWAWLVVTPEGKLAVTSTPNQDNPLMDLAPVKGTPILGNDVWEHAYYLTYRNRRGDYLSKWWDVVNWGHVNELFAEASARR